jgi:hypothetical protein
MEVQALFTLSLLLWGLATAVCLYLWNNALWQVRDALVCFRKLLVWLVDHAALPLPVPPLLPL